MSTQTDELADEELTAAVTDDADNELDRIDPVPDYLTLQGGIEVHLLPLRTRQLFKLLRIITHGAGQQLLTSGIDFQDEPQVFIQKLLGLVLFSIPDAEQEAIDFLQSMVEPGDLCEKAVRDMTKAEREGNIASWTALNMELFNPDPSDTIDIIELIVKRESGDLQALGKRLRQFLELASKTGQLKAESNGGGSTPQQVLNLPENSAGSSTSSQASTDGTTKRSSTSRSAASDKSSQRSPRASGKRSASVGS